MYVNVVCPDPREAKAPIVRAGYGSCSKCGCQGYEGNASTCGNGGCGHAYGDHN